MKVIDKLISFIFDVVIIIVAAAILLVKFNVIQDEILLGLFNDYLFNPQYDIIVISSCIVIILLALKVTVFTSSFSKKAKKNILVDTEHGKIQISQNTVENIAKNVVKDYPQVKDVQAVMTKAKKGINMYMSLIAYQGVNIKDIVTRVQADVKEQIEATIGIAVFNIDVKIKNVIKADVVYKTTQQTNDVAAPTAKKETVVTPEVATPKVEPTPVATENNENEQNQ
ncbi:MAG: alkaline shock response membrane anchor protein AmaP [Clostridia bacterium]|nr:alkaline shock response membrane anchor protein AmaP [Clostridia bacterium]